MRTISQLLLTFLLNACWQIALITAVAALCARLLRGTTARHRHLLWVSALIFSFGLPALTCFSFSGSAFFSEPPRAIDQSAVEAIEPEPQAVMDTQEAPPTALKESASFISVNRNVAAVIIVLYLLFLCYRSSKLFKAWRSAKSLTRGACAIDLPELVRTTAGACQTAFGLKRFRILCSTSITAPIAAGGLDPLIILPERLLLEKDRSVLTAAIGHELAHVLRRDYLLNLIYELISIPLSLHPGTALLKRRIRETRELSCDELVTEKLMDAAVYARSLVHLAGSAVNLNRPGATITVGVADADILEERVMSILRKPNMNSHRRKLSLAAAALVFVVPCAASAPFGLSVGVNLDVAAATPRDIAPQSTVAPSQQGAEQEATPSMKTRKRRKQIEITGDGTIKLAELETRQREEQAKQGDAPILKKRRRIELKDEREAKEKGLQPKVVKRITYVMEERRQAELAKKAIVTMQQAIQIAMNQQAGTVTECRLMESRSAGKQPDGEKNQVFYSLTIVSGDGPEATTTRMLISAIDGRIIDSRKVEK